MTSTTTKAKQRIGCFFCALLLVSTAALEAAPSSLPQNPSYLRTKSERDGAPMVLIPAGPFLMGSNDGHEDEQPVHQVRLNAYYLDVYEVTVKRYAAFLKAVNAERPMAWQEATNGSHDEKPVVGVDWYDAAEYCEWAGRRLPTEAEWEKAARGTDERRYPWGEEAPTRSHANFGRDQWKGYATLADVGRYSKGQSPYGVHDLAGNVWEWVADRYDQAYYTESPLENPSGSSVGPLRVLRGGAWSNEGSILRGSNRGGYHPAAHRSDFGFRCAMDVIS